MSTITLRSVKRGTVIRPPRIVLLGIEKVGKSTFAAGADNAIFIPITLEEGIDSIDVPRFPVVSTLDQLKECLGVLADEDHGFETVVIDSGTALEPVIWKAVCEEGGVDSIENYGGGYGKGYTRALELWNEVEGMLDYLRDEKRMASIIIGHVKVKRFDDPERESYDTYQFDINEKAANSLYRWADCILFANRSVFTRQEDAGFNKKKVKAEDAGERILCTQKTPAHPGGGRGVWGRLEDEIELSWQAFKEACEAARKASEPKKNTAAKKK